MKQKSGLKLTRSKSILVVLYAIYIAFILVSAVPYLADMGQRGQKVGDNYEYHVVLESDGNDVAHYFDVDLADDAQVGTIDLEYVPASHTLNVDVTNIQKLTMDCESFYEDEAEFLLETTYADDTDYYKEWFIAGGGTHIDPFTVNVDTDTAMTFVKFDGVPEPYEVFVDPVEEDRQEWWQSETHYDKTGDSVTVTNVPVGATLVEIYFQAPDNNAPTAIFPAPSTAFVDASVSFDGSGSSDPDDDPLTFSWDFDDGSSPGTGETTTHTYTTAGTYTVELTVSDGKGGVDTHTETVQIIEVGAGDPPVADWTMPGSAQAGKEVSFNAGGSSDPDGSISSYSWDFDNDGTEDATGVTAKHTYTDAGEYTVKLTVTDNDGLTNTVTDTITITTEPVVDDDDDDDDDEGMLGLGKVAGIDLFLIILIIIIVVIVIIAGVAAGGKKKKKAEAAAAAAQPPPEAAGPPGAPPEQPPMYPEQPPMYEEQPMEQPPMYEEQPMAPPPMEEAPVMPEGEVMPPVEEPPVEEPAMPDEGETLPEPEAEEELPDEELPEEELAAEEEIPAEPTEGEAPPSEEPAAEEQPPAEEGGAEAEMTSCPACGAPIAVGAPVCPSCNSEFEW